MESFQFVRLSKHNQGFYVASGGPIPFGHIVTDDSLTGNVGVVGVFGYVRGLLLVQFPSYRHGAARVNERSRHLVCLQLAVLPIHM